jgi:glycosyltransferase involved in cell wall biosynthesis
MVHNYYQQKAGEDLSFEAESKLLKDHGHKVIKYTKHNNQIKNMNSIDLFRKMVWNKKTYNDLCRIIQKEKPDIVHFQNTFPLISPSAYYAAKAEGIPIIQSLRNYRLFCPAATFSRNGQICEKCSKKSFFWSIIHGCYHNSRIKTGALTTMLVIHHFMKTWQKKVDVYIANTKFSKKKFIQGGLSAKKIFIKPNFVDSDPEIQKNKGNYALFIGRLSPEKGIFTMLRAWKSLKNIPLKIIGTGPIKRDVEKFIQQNKLKNIELVGYCPKEKVFSYIKKSRFLIFPSEWYETFGRTIIEAFACSIPIIISRLGAMKEIVKDNYTGLNFEPGNAKDLVEKIKWAWTHKKDMQRMGENARKDYEEKYTPKKNYKQLMKIYQFAINNENSNI